MPVCTRCGALNEAPSRSCRVCSADLAAPAPIAAAAPKPVAPAAFAPSPVAEPIAPLVDATPAAAARSDRFWMCAVLFVLAIAGGALLWRSSDMKYDTSGPGTLDVQYTVVTKNSVTSYEVGYTFTAKGKQFTGKDTVGIEPNAADTTVYYMSADPSDNSLHETTSNTTRMIATGVAFLVALIAFILMPKNYLMKIGIPSPAPGIGDSQGEPFTMKHGKYHAWIYVYIAFVLQIAAVGFLFDLAVSLIAKSPMLSYVPLGIAAAVAAFLALWVYSDRWRCIEATTSRSCSGNMNLSILYVPFVALVYANIRGLRKFAGR